MPAVSKGTSVVLPDPFMLVAAAGLTRPHPHLCHLSSDYRLENEHHTQPQVPADRGPSCGVPACPGKAWSPAPQGQGAWAPQGPDASWRHRGRTGPGLCGCSWLGEYFVPAGLRNCAQRPEGTTRAKQPPNTTKMFQWLKAFEAGSGGGVGSVRVTEGGMHKVQRGKELQVYDYICQQKGQDQDGISGAKDGERGIYVRCKGQSEKPVGPGAGGTRCRRPPGNGEAVNHATYKENNRTIVGRAESPKQSIREHKNVSPLWGVFGGTPACTLTLCPGWGFPKSRCPEGVADLQGKCLCHSGCAPTAMYVGVLPSEGLGARTGAPDGRVMEVRQASPSDLWVELCPPQWHSQVPVHKTSEWGLMQKQGYCQCN